jgi:hypothetical protein
MLIRGPLVGVTGYDEQQSTATDLVAIEPWSAPLLATVTAADRS